MKIVALGNYSAPWCSEVHFARELEALGHTVDRMQEPQAADNSTLHELETRAHDAALVLWTRTWGLPERATKLWRRLEADGTVTASYHLDLYHGLARADAIDRDPFWTTQHVFTPDGNPDAAEWFAAHGINHHWSPPAVVSDECAVVMPGTYRADFAHDVVFVGSLGYHDEWPWRRQLIEWLAATYGPRFRRYGGDTGYDLDGRHYPLPVRGRHLNDLYASAKVVVGDSCFARPDTRYFSDRPFESYGRGAYMLFPRITKLTEMIGPYPSYSVGDFDGLRDLIDSALAQPAACRRVADQLAAIVHAQHTYQHRFAKALDVMGLA